MECNCNEDLRHDYAARSYCTLSYCNVVCRPAIRHGAARVAFIALAVAGVWVLCKDRRLAKSIGIKQLGLIVLLIGVPGILSLWNSVNVEETRKFILFMPIFFFAGATIYSLFMNEKLLAVLTTIIAITSIVWILDGIWQYFTGSDLLGNPLLGVLQCV